MQKTTPLRVKQASFQYTGGALPTFQRTPSFNIWFNNKTLLKACEAKPGSDAKPTDAKPTDAKPTDADAKTLLQRLNVFNFKFPKRIQYMSDLHLEDNTVPDFKVVGDYLVLAGDIGDPFSGDFEDFIQTVCAKYRHVFYVPGNHEYYFGNMDTVNLQLLMIASTYPNFHVLNNNVYDLSPDVRIIGTTLWSNMNDMVAMNIGDFSHIKVNGKDYMTPSRHRKLHTTAVKFIEEQIERCKRESKQAVVITHHAGHLCMLGKYAGHMLNSAYATDLSCLYASPVVAWISGHTHERIDMTVNGVKCVSNCLGYDTEQTNFNPSASITIYM
jgi:predicted phosphodiesterase